MPGFFVSNRRVKVELRNRYPERCVQEELNSAEVTAKRNTLNKFMLDKSLAEADDCIVIMEGYLLNKLALFEQYGVDNVADLAATMYRKKGDAFFSEFRGGFAGALCDKKLDKWLVFTNQSGDNPVFYAKTADGFYAGSQVNYVVDACKSAGVSLTFDESAAYQMLTYAFMTNDVTFSREIKRLRGGTYLYFQGGEGCVKTYHTFKKDPSRFASCTEDEMIEQIDRAFRAAVKLEYDKDREYGYEHLTDISGGLDSRMTTWVPYEMGYNPIQLLTYCKANYADELIAKEIAGYWKAPLLVKPLDDAAFLYDIDEVTFLNGGLSLYSAISGGNHMLRSMNMDRYGVEHTGMNGDVILGSWYRKVDDGQRRWPTGRYSNKLSHRLPESVLRYVESFDDHEIFMWYTRGFQGMANTYQIRKNYTEASSPFMNVEFMQVCMDIPVQYRMGHGIYKKWILAKYPQAAQFKWEKTNAKITESKLVGKLRHIFTNGPKKLLRMMGKASAISTVMVPFEYFLARNEKLRAYRDRYFEEGIAQLPISLPEQLKTDMRELYQTGTANEQSMVLTVLAAVKLYFGK